MIGYAIGTGASEPPVSINFPFEHRKQSSYLYIDSHGEYVIIDFGTDPFQYTRKHSLASFITHWHSDHTAGLYSARWYEKAYRLYSPLEGEWITNEPKNTLPIFPEPFKTIKFKNFKVTPLPLNHGIETYGYFIEADDQKIAHLTDTKGLPADTLEYLLENPPDKIVLDATFLTLKCCGKKYGLDKGDGHNNTNDILRVHDNFPGSEIYLTHLPPYAPPTWIITKILPWAKVLHDSSVF